MQKGYGKTQVDSVLLNDFFLTFARFEYALKESGFLIEPDCEKYRPHNPPSAMPDWEKFSRSLVQYFKFNINDRLEQACFFLLNSPPNRQVVLWNDDKWEIAWETLIRSENQTDIEFMLKAVRTVRNNLFHGGKYSIDWQEDTKMTEHLLSCSLIVLEECLRLAPKVSICFEEAVL